MMSPTVISLVEGVASPIRCVCWGGYPPPSLEVRLGWRDVTSDFEFIHSAAMSGGRGLRTMTYRTERWTESFSASVDDDAAILKCISTVPGMRPYTEYVKLSVDCELFFYNIFFVYVLLCESFFYY